MVTSPQKTAALIVAAGRGSRAPGDLPKQYRPLAGRPVLARTLDAFVSHPRIHAVAVVIAASDKAHYAAVSPEKAGLPPPIDGGANRQESVRLGLVGLGNVEPDQVLIHDAVRPFASPDLIDRVILALEQNDAVVPTLPVSSTLKTVDGGMVTGTVPRDGLQTAETPQGFRYAAILTAHERAHADGLAFTDDAAVAEWAGIPVVAVAGEAGNVKLTTPGDFDMAEHRLAAEVALAAGDVRVGTGFDVHAFGSGVEVVLGGIHIPYGRGLTGHSDADVVLHALTDAILGALADGDIGDHFPPSDPQWRGVSSDRFLAFAAGRVTARGGRIAHLDVSVVAEDPKIAPHRDEMRRKIAAICGVSPDRVAVKATTNEGLGFIGRGEGIAATATATIRLPFGGAT
jgi:2-C-methyl-D-erythritol 4-phosphate cytidylyltransferase/2-C-methyl-D-erythritol 2,4-cyclodiphosphate synthase